jgi:tetratricopeptide (TPR) repeat protein
MKAYSIVAAVGLALTVTACSPDPQKAKLRFFQSGEAYFTQRNYAEAIVQYRNAVARDGSYGEARFKLGQAYEATGDLRNAIREYVRAADLMPKNVPAQIAAARLLIEAGQFPEAKERALTALSEDSKNAEALILLGNALAGMKDLDGAVKEVEKAIDTDPTRVLSYGNLGLLEIAKGNKAGAEAAFKRAIEISPKSAQAHLSLANYYWASERPADAEKEFKTALTLEPKSVSGNRGLALFYFNAHREKEAEQYLKAYADITSETGPRLILIDFYLSTNKVAEASAVLNQLQQTKDGFAPAKMRFAAIDFAAGRQDNAFKKVDEVLARDPHDENALLEKGRFFMAQAKPAEAVKLADLVLKGNANSAPAHFLRAASLEGTGELDDAIQSFQEVIRLDPSAFQPQLRLATLYLRRRNPKAAAELLGQVLKKQPQSGAAHYWYARTLLRLGDLVDTEREVAELVKDNPSSPDTQTLLGDFYWEKHDWARSRAAYTKALDLQPSSLDALSGLVRVNMVENKLPVARQLIDARSPQNSKDERLLLLAGSTYYLIGDFKQSEITFRRVLDVNPASLEAYNRLARLYLTQHRLDEAKQDYEDAVKQQPKIAVAASTMVGVILTMQNKPAEARKSYEQALALNSKAAVAANNLAWIYAENGGANLDVALQLAQTAKAQLPENAQTSDTLGWIYYKKGLGTLAIQALRQSVEQDPKNAVVHYHLGLAYVQAGERKLGAQSLQEALKLDPAFESAADAKKVLATIKS